MNVCMRIVYALITAGLLLLGGCSSLTVKESWHKTGEPARKYKKLMILAIANDEGRRKLFENVMVDELGRNGVTAMASHTLINDLEKAGKSEIVAAVKAAGADGVITARPVSVGDKTVTQEGVAGAPFGTAASGYMNLAGSKDFLRAMLQTNLYDSETAELVWTATIDTFDAERIARVSRDLAKLLAERLRRDGLL
ncbi:MAG: hypothetical protein ED859_10955 [Desulfuromonadales bacterium]|nr:MAG: hypothetical protein ED859_10955 [Desulfuromonadales bacterium]